MRKPASMWSLETLGRVRLSKHFYMREFLYSEIGNFHQIQNIPEDPDLAIKRGKMFCETVLDPLQDTFGRVFVRSGYRSPNLNAFGNAHKLNCARNEYPLECHIWDLQNIEVAGASIVLPWFADQFGKGRDWQDLAWWLYDHVPFAEAWFFPKLCAFNISWRPDPGRRLDSYIVPRGTLCRAFAEPPVSLEERQLRYRDFPKFRGVVTP